MGGLSRGLLHLDLEGSRILEPAALREPLLQIRNRRQRGVSLPKLVLRIGLPIERGIRLRAVQLGELAEFVGSLVEAVFVQSFSSVAVKLVETLGSLLLAVSLFLCAVSCFFFAVTFLLFPVACLLSTILGILVLPRFRERLVPAVGRRRFRQPRRDKQGCRHYPNLYRPARFFSDTHALFLSLGSDPVAAGAEFVVFCFSCNSLPTTRTLNKMPCASMRFCSDSSFAGVSSSGLCATSSNTRSRSSRTLASAASPSCLAVSRYSLLASSKSSARFCSAEILISFGPELGGAAFASSISIISDL